MGKGQMLLARRCCSRRDNSEITETIDDVIYEILIILKTELPESSNEIKAMNYYRYVVDGNVHVSQNSLAFQIGPNQGQLAHFR
ncbi:MAG: hypothetical protein Ct9H300mP28_28660 [Pseudomonadota bacterium]|nr:MAG: hypothetical protein Ct9H300mP28_28660 [Pseudomonadota bacterium]